MILLAELIKRENAFQSFVQNLRTKNSSILEDLYELTFQMIANNINNGHQNMNKSPMGDILETYGEGFKDLDQGLPETG